MILKNNEPHFQKYLNDRQTISNDLTSNYSVNLLSGQVSLLCSVSLASSKLSKETQDFVVQESYEHPSISILFFKAPYFLQQEFEVFCDALNGLNQVDQRAFFILSDQVLFEKADVNSDIAFGDDVVKYLQKVKDVVQNGMADVGDVKNTQLVSNAMHVTGSKRQQDGNFFVRDHHEKHFQSKRLKALFVGGSLGITCVDFQNDLNDYADHWEVLNMDLFRPKDIYQRMMNGEKNDFPVPETVQYLQSDMTQLPFDSAEFDFLDVSNSTGYIENLQLRLDVVRKIWKLLKVGGLCRFVSPGYETVFDQVIFKKTGPAYADAELLFVSQWGKSTLKGSGEDRYQHSKQLSEKVIPLWQELSKNKALFPRDKVGKNVRDRLRSDIAHLNPILFAAGIWDDVRCFAEYDQNKVALDQNIYKIIMTEL